MPVLESFCWLPRMIIWNRKDNTPLLTLCSQSLLANKRLFPLQAWTVFLAFFPLCVESIVVVYLLICYLLVPRFDGKSVHPFLHIRSPPARRRFHHRYGKCPKNFLLKLETILYFCVIPNSVKVQTFFQKAFHQHFFTRQTLSLTNSIAQTKHPAKKQRLLWVPSNMSRW